MAETGMADMRRADTACADNGFADEEAIVMHCKGEHMLAVLTPPQPQQAHPGLADTGVIIIVGGPQYRVGSHRQFVHLARSLAQQGVTALRFDTRGMGDSSGAQRTLEAIEADIGAAIDSLQAARPAIKRVVLWGLCGGASAALLYVRHFDDARVQGLVLVNPWVRTDESLARTRLSHYYVKRLGQRAFWLKLLSFKLAPREAAAELMENIRVLRHARAGSSNHAGGPPAGHAAQSAQPGQAVSMSAPLYQRMAQAWAQFDGPKLLVLSGEDFTAQEFVDTAAAYPLWQQNLAQPGVTRFDVPGADHTFSDRTAQQSVQTQTWQWLVQALATPSGP